MKRCYFIGLNEIYDSQLKKRIFEELEKIVKSEEVIEFWFFKKNSHFLSNCLYIALLLKYKYPQKDIRIVRVIDPIKYTPHKDEDKAIYDDEFPYCLVDQFVYANYAETDPIKARTNFIGRLNQVERWAINQCNYIISYYYSIIDFHFDRIGTSKSKKPDISVIYFSFDKTEQLIREELETLDQRIKDIFNMIYLEKSISNVAEKFDISSNRIHQLTKKARYSIYHRIRKRNLNSVPKRDRVCCLISLNENPTIRQINLFNCFLKYLVRECEIREFWIDEKTCNTPYADALLEFDRMPLIKVFMPIGEGKEDAWENFTGKYKSKFSNIMGISSFDANIYKDIICRAKYLVTDFTCTKSSIIRELCIPENDVCVFDVSYRPMEFDYQYL